MKDFAIRYLNGPLQGDGSMSVPDDTPEPPLVQRIPLPREREPGIRSTMSKTYIPLLHAIYERAALNSETGAWEFSLVRIE